MNDPVVVKKGEAVIFELESRPLAKVVLDKSMKLYEGGIVVEDGCPYYILSITKKGKYTKVSLIFQDFYQIHYRNNKSPVIYTSEDNYVDEDE